MSQSLDVTVASGDALDVKQFAVEERISALFSVDLVVLCNNPNIDFDSVVGQPASFLTRYGLLDQPRFWTGVCNRFEQIVAEETGLSTYRLTIVPPLWLAAQRRNYRIFQQLSELEIVLDLLAEWEIRPEQRFDLASYKKREYRVQYAESDYAFLSRMLEEAGVSFYFEQGDSETRLVLTDAPQMGARRLLPLVFREDATATHGIDYATSVRVVQEIRPDRYTVRDHDDRRPPANQPTATASTETAAAPGLESYDYASGSFLFESKKGGDTPIADDRGAFRTDDAEASSLAQRRLDAAREGARVVSFNTSATDIAPGAVVSILDHPRTELAGGLLVVSSKFSGSSDGTRLHQCEARGADRTHRPPLSTPKPRISGVESATVVGPPEEEIYVDELGRVRVHFHWDRSTEANPRSSCWIHVSHSWAGTGFGVVNLPRIGQEVLVDFLGGDPDRPIITGRVYTKLQQVPYKLPEHKTQSGWKSHSTSHTGGYNELMFEDAAGRELVRMQAEKNLSKLVKNNESVNIGHNRSKSVGNDDSLNVGNNRSRMVGNNESVTVGLNQTVTVGLNQTITVGADQTITLTEGNQTETLTKGNRTFTMTGDLSETITGSSSRTQTGDQTEFQKGDQSEILHGGRSLIQVGDQSELLVGSKSVIQAGGRKDIMLGHEMRVQVGDSNAFQFGGVTDFQKGARSETRIGPQKIHVSGPIAETVSGASVLAQVGDNSETITGSKTVTVTTSVNVFSPTVNISGGNMVVIKGGVIKLNC